MRELTWLQQVWNVLNLFFKNMTPENVAEVKSHGLEINTWTVNEEEDIREMFRVGVDSVIGNYPDLVNKIRNNG